jgi:hypothetical protein
VVEIAMFSEMMFRGKWCTRNFQTSGKCVSAPPPHLATIALGARTTASPKGPLLRWPLGEEELGLGVEHEAGPLSARLSLRNSAQRLLFN